MKIITEYRLKPIPLRCFDWIAVYDGDESRYGYGATEEEAIQRLKDNF